MPSIVYGYFFYYILWINWGPLPFLKGTNQLLDQNGKGINHALVFSRVVPPYTFGIKPPMLMLSLIIIIFFQVLNFPHYFYIYIIYPLNAMSNS